MDATLAFQRIEQLRQYPLGLNNDFHHTIIGAHRLVEHAVKHVLDLPAELAQSQSANQSAAALQCMEHTTYGLQRFCRIRLLAPNRQQAVQIVDLLLHLFDKDFANLFVDLVTGRLKAADQHRRGSGRADFRFAGRRSGCFGCSGRRRHRFNRFGARGLRYRPLNRCFSLNIEFV